MKEEYDRWEEEDEIEPMDKFDECWLCKHRFKHNLCFNECGNGEFFEEEDPDDLEDIIIK